MGAGDVKWPPIFELLEKEAPIQAYVIEQEKYMAGPMESVKECADYMKKVGRG